MEERHIWCRWRFIYNLSFMLPRVSIVNLLIYKSIILRIFLSIRLGRQGDPLGNVLEIQFDLTNKRYMHNPALVLENDSHKFLWDFNIQTDHLIPASRLDSIIINKKNRICKIVDLAVPADHRINLKESEKKDKYLDLARELKKRWNMKVTIIPVVIGA